MIIPAVFFISVILEQFFGNSLLMESIFVPIDRTSGLLSAFFMIGFPFISICINIIPLMNFKIKKEKDVLKFTFEIKPQLFNIIITGLGFLTIAVILGYLFTENFKLK